MTRGTWPKSQSEGHARAGQSHPIPSSPVQSDCIKFQLSPPSSKLDVDVLQTIHY